MTNRIETPMNAQGARVAVVVSRFNDIITTRLFDGAVNCLKRHEIKETDITEVWVPGAFELPLVAQTLAETGQYEAVICLGAVIRGATTHYDYVCSESAKGIATVGLKTKIPVIFGVLTTENLEQAMERAGGKAGNKGYEAALTAIEMTSLMRRLKTNRL